MFFHAILISGKVGQVSRTSSQETLPKNTTKRVRQLSLSLSEAHANDEDEDMLKEMASGKSGSVVFRRQMS